MDGAPQRSGSCLAQYMSWTQSRNIDIHLCATKDSKQFYEYLNFERYDSDMTKMPPLIKKHLDDESIEKEGIYENELFPMYLKDTLLASVPLPVSRALKNYYQILLANKTTGVWDISRKQSSRTENDFAAVVHDDIVEKQWQIYDEFIINKPKWFEKIHFRTYNAWMDDHKAK